ncbi:hypothetical protein [Nesterenkonia sedimenti]|nr:hypothetical protein [Nesterenkonia sedimenti]
MAITLYTGKDEAAAFEDVDAEVSEAVLDEMADKVLTYRGE